MKGINLMRVSLKCTITIILWVGLNLAQAAATLPAVATANRCQDQAYVNKIHDLWNSRKPTYAAWIANSKDDSYNLYNVQIETNNLLIYAGRCHDTVILGELLSIYLPAIDTLKSMDYYQFYYYPSSARQTKRKLPKLSKMWLTKDTSIGTENILSSAQFLYLIADAINIISEIAPTERTPLMASLLTKYTPVLIDHYQRWIFDAVGPFQVRGWGCAVNGKYVETGMNHQKYLIKSLTKALGAGSSVSYCNAVTDTDMWIIAGVTKLIAASKKTTLNLSISAAAVTNYLNYIKLGVRLLETRTTLKDLNDFSGKIVQGANFDLGVWDDHEDYKYTGYELAEYPRFNDKDLKKYSKKNASWDISHARRFINVFQTLYENKTLLGLTFPSQAIMQGLANQFIYGTFNGDFDMPLFANFMDGSNGWFRVGYLGRVGFGYAPNDQSIAALTGGYGFLSEYNVDISKLFCKLEVMVNSKSANIRKHVIDHYESVYQNNYVKVRSADYTNLNNAETQSNFLSFYPALYNVSHSCP
ncbi:MAG: hypothetical protein HOP02_07895 [Methylococcaceae bacterium]|nr:hypothetical protein [Methylococcaceae bacterium]